MSFLNQINNESLDAVSAVAKKTALKIDALHKGVKELIEDLELAVVDRPLGMTELSEILGISVTAVHKWKAPHIKAGVRLSYVYGYLKNEKPVYVKKLEEYIKKESAKKLNLVEYKRTGS